MIADSSYSRSESKKHADEKNVDLITTDLIGKMLTRFTLN